MTTATVEGGTSLNDQIAGEIRAWMGRRRMNQAALGRAINENEMWVSRRIRGTQVLTVTDLARIAEALGVEVVDLLPRDTVSPNKRSDALTDRPMSGPPRVKTHPNGRPRNNPTRPTSPVRPSQRRPAPTRSSARRMAA